MTDVFSAEVTTQADPNTDYMAELVGEGKKFKTPAELAKGKIEADRHIENLNKTLNELRDELRTRQTSEELINKIASLSQNRQEQPTEPTRQPNTEQTVTGLKQEDVERMFTERENLRRQSDNLQNAQAKLIERYGEAAPAEIESKAKELGVSRDHLKEMAKTTPSVFLALFTAPAVPKDVFGSPSTGRTTTLDTQGLPSGIKKFSDYQKLRRENSVEYFGKKVQAELIALGDKLGGPGNPAYEKWRNS